MFTRGVKINYITVRSNPNTPPALPGHVSCVASLATHTKPLLRGVLLLVVMMTTTVVLNFGAQQDAVLHYGLPPPQAAKVSLSSSLPQGFKL